jgi:small-conductance mechanosensitive channel
MKKNKVMTTTAAALAALTLAGDALAARAPILSSLTGGSSSSGSATQDLSNIVGLVRWAGVLMSVLVVIGAAVALRFLTGLVERLNARFAHRRLTFQKIESFTRFFIYFATGAIVLGLSFQINQTVLTLVGGTFAVAVGFAMRDLVAAMIAGVIIMFDRPFQVGDRVQYGGQYGDIVAIGLRSVRMFTLDDNVVTIPNNKILTDVSSCGNYGALEMQVQFDFYIGMDQDFELAERLISEGILSSRYVYLDQQVQVLISQVIQQDYVAIHLRGKAYVFDTKYEKPFVTDVMRRVLRAFRENSILPPAVLHRSVEAPSLPARRPPSLRPS